jgi:hypothetical protein
MVSAASNSLLPTVSTWFATMPNVHAVVLFGSQARASAAPAAADRWSDIDLHVIGSKLDRLVKTDWTRVFPEGHVCLQVLRPASGGVRKLTVLLAEGGIDMVLIPSVKLHLADFAFKLGLHRKIPSVNFALNDFATIMSGGYRFLKGEERWGRFYAHVVTEMAGCRVDDTNAHNLAEVFLCDLVWVLQKIERGELVAAQRVLHRNLLETNVVLLHELRLRKGLVTFREARRVERLVSSDLLSTVQLNGKLTPEELRGAAWHAFSGLRTLMAQLSPAWRVPHAMNELLARHGSPSGIAPI